MCVCVLTEGITLVFYISKYFFKNYFYYCTFISDINTVMSLAQGMTSKIIFFMHMAVLAAFMCTCTQRPEEGVRFSGNEVTDSHRH